MRRSVTLAVRRFSLLLVVLGLLAAQPGMSSAGALCGLQSCTPAASCDATMSSHDCCCSMSEAPAPATLRVDASSLSFHLGLAVRALVAAVVEPARPSRLAVVSRAPVTVLLTGTGASRAPPSPSASLS